MIEWIAVRLPRSWRLAVLKGFAGSEFEVACDWLVPDPSSMIGFRVEKVSLSDVSVKVAEARLVMIDAALSPTVGE